MTYKLRPSPQGLFPAWGTRHLQAPFVQFTVLRPKEPIPVFHLHSRLLRLKSRFETSNKLPFLYKENLSEIPRMRRIASGMPAFGRRPPIPAGYKRQVSGLSLCVGGLARPGGFSAGTHGQRIGHPNCGAHPRLQWAINLVRIRTMISDCPSLTVPPLWNGLFQVVHWTHPFPFPVYIIARPAFKIH